MRCHRLVKQFSSLRDRLKELAIARKLESNPAEVDLAQRQLYVRGRAGENASQQTAIAGASRQHPAAADSENSFEALARKAAAAKAAGQMDATISYYQIL
ncbi:MAG TPA: hypothetical protein VE957_17350 [Terriglobales bacterium]|nr:hypothetical protein [Terriglobales bacterium]